MRHNRHLAGVGNSIATIGGRTWILLSGRCRIHHNSFAADANDKPLSTQSSFARAALAIHWGLYRFWRRSR